MRATLRRIARSPLAEQIMAAAATVLEPAGRRGPSDVAVLTYHRVDEPGARPHLHPGLISATPRAFDAIITDVLTRGISILQLPPTQLARVTSVSEAQRLDFDDAFVYTIAEDHDLIIVSFDADFDHTARGRKTPEALLSAT